MLYATAESLRAVAVLLAPVMPKACAILWDSVGGGSIGALPAQRVQDAGRWGQLPAGATVTKSDQLFPRIEEQPAT